LCFLYPKFMHNVVLRVRRQTAGINGHDECTSRFESPRESGRNLFGLLRVELRHGQFNVFGNVFQAFVQKGVIAVLRKIGDAHERNVDPFVETCFLGWHINRSGPTMIRNGGASRWSRPGTAVLRLLKAKTSARYLNVVLSEYRVIIERRNFKVRGERTFIPLLMNVIVETDRNVLTGGVVVETLRIAHRKEGRTGINL